MMSKNILRVACAQTGSVEDNGDISASLKSARGYIEAAAEKGADIVIFPELFLAPFFPRQLRKDVNDYFMSVEDESFRILSMACRDNAINAIIPIGERAGPVFYNSAVFVDAKGEVAGIYRKTHMPAYFPSLSPGGTGSYEKFYFAPGESLPTFDLSGTEIGIQICNDRLYPEASRTLAMKGARIIFMPISYSTYDKDEQRRSNWEIILRARAIENGVFVVACNRVGDEGPRHHLGCSMVIGPGGNVLAKGSDIREELITCDLNLDELDAARFDMPWWRDRRPSLYAPLAKTDITTM